MSIVSQMVHCSTEAKLNGFRVKNFFASFNEVMTICSELGVHYSVLSDFCVDGIPVRINHRVWDDGVDVWRTT